MLEMTCENCGTVYHVKPYRKGKSHFCSRRCTALARLPDSKEKRLKAVVTHGQAGSTKSPEYLTWERIKARCSPNGCYYRLGIRVCAEWRNDFVAFYNHIGPKPSPQHSIDRYPDPKGDYKPGNVRWATRKEQSWSKIGKKVSQRTRRKMSIAQSNPSPERRAKLSASHQARKQRLGYINSPETRAKLSSAAKKQHKCRRRQGLPSPGGHRYKS